MNAILTAVSPYTRMSQGELLDLAEAHSIDVTCRWAPTSFGRALPQLMSVSLRFKKDAPQAWREINTRTFDFGCSISGTRIVTGSGATDDTLRPCYLALLDEVNARREALGLGRIRK